MGEVEENNDAARLRRTRLLRGIRKMRLERAILLESLAKRMRKNGAGGAMGMYDEDSENSSDNPPTVRPEPSPSTMYSSLKPQERPLRTKKSHRRALASPPPGGLSQQQPLPSASSQPPPSSNPLTSGPEGEKLSTAERVASPAASTNMRPPPPKELFIQSSINNYLEREQEDDSYLKPDELRAKFQKDWNTLSNNGRASWNKTYEERMALFTRIEDQRKRAMNAEWRKAKQQGKPESGDDVDMVEAGEDNGDGEGSGSKKGFAAVNG